MNIQEYIESGIVEAYCLGVLGEEEAREVSALAAQFPELEAEIERNLAALEQSVRVKPAALRPELQQNMMQIWAQLQAESSLDLENPPMIHRHSDISVWNRALAHVEADVLLDDVKLHYLKDTEDYQLMVAWVNTELMEDAHHQDEFQESFLILEGCCECDLDGEVIRLQAGDYLDIPFEVTHTFKNISPAPLTYVKALIQRRKVA